MPIDQSPEAVRARLMRAGEMHDIGVEMKRQQLARQHPGASNEELEELIVDWLTSRPMDADGIRRPWPRSSNPR